MIEEDNLEECDEGQKDIFMYNMLAREELLSTLSKTKFSQVKTLRLSHEVWIALKNIFEGDNHARKFRLKNWICLFEDAKMMEDESIRIYVGRISEITTGIRSQGGTKEDDEVI